MTQANYYIGPATIEDWEDAMEVCWRTFLEFEAREYSEEGVKHFLDFISSNELFKMFKAGEYTMFVAKETGSNKIIGVASLRSLHHISLLFVDKKYHKQGVGKALVKNLQNNLRRGDVRMTVNAAPYAVGFYHKLGFIDTKEEQLTDGIIYTPMTLVTQIA